MSRFTPKRGIGEACREAARKTRLERVERIRMRYCERLSELRHERLDNWLYGELKRLQASEAV
jgi:hypothetical protein